VGEGIEMGLSTHPPSALALQALAGPASLRSHRGVHLTRAVLRIRETRRWTETSGEVYGAQSATMSCRLARSLYSQLSRAVSSSPGAHTLSRIHQTMHIASCLPSSTTRDRPRYQTTSQSNAAKPQSGIVDADSRDASRAWMHCSEGMDT
jgi:hypothetical protein